MKVPIVSHHRQIANPSATACKSLGSIPTSTSFSTCSVTASPFRQIPSMDYGIYAYSISNQYGPIPRFLYYSLLGISLLSHTHEWSVGGTLGASMKFNSIAAVHAIALAAVRGRGAVDLDIIPGLKQRWKSVSFAMFFGLDSDISIHSHKSRWKRQTCYGREAPQVTETGEMFTIHFL